MKAETKIEKIKECLLKQIETEDGISFIERIGDTAWSIQLECQKPFAICIKKNKGEDACVKLESIDAIYYELIENNKTIFDYIDVLMNRQGLTMAEKEMFFTDSRNPELEDPITYSIVMGVICNHMDNTQLQSELKKSTEREHYELADIIKTRIENLRKTSPDCD